MPLLQRAFYLARNAVVNLLGFRPFAAVESFHSEATATQGTVSSPSRHLTDAFIREHLPKLFEPGHVRVLEVGCGSGSLCAKLEGCGYSGHYTGIDIEERFSASGSDSLQVVFIKTDARGFSPDEKFDLIISISVLEHIDNDQQVIGNLRNLLSEGGAQFHVVPSGWGLPLYLWHGYRQYNVGAIRTRFPEGKIYSLGGACSFLHHFVWITVAEMVFGMPVRKWAPGLYIRMATLGRRLDRVLPFMPAAHVVVSPCEN